LPTIHSESSPAHPRIGVIRPGAALGRIARRRAADGYQSGSLAEAHRREALLTAIRRQLRRPHARSPFSDPAR